jgi:hypothetical protein
MYLKRCRLEFKMSNIVKPIEAEFFPEGRPKRGWLFPWTC